MPVPPDFSPPPLSARTTRRERRWLRWLAGMVVANLAIALLYGGVVLLLAWLKNGDGLLKDDNRFLWPVAVPSLFWVPLCGGVLASFVWRKLEPTLGATALSCLWLTLLGLGGAAVFLREGAICLLIVSPLFYVMVLAGALAGRVWFRRAALARLRLSLAPALLLALCAVAEPFTRGGADDAEGVVRDELLIRAAPAAVWPGVTTFGDIPAPPRFWLFRLGLPYPMATTVEGDFVGAARRCVFSRGAVFEETVAELVPREKLTFDIVRIPPDPELLGHLSPRRGQFLLHDNGDGTTTLVGSTWYVLHVRPLAYFDWWTAHIFRAVHLRVMEDVRRRAEAPH